MKTKKRIEEPKREKLDLVIERLEKKVSNSAAPSTCIRMYCIP
jgi:hypothetical protein